MAKKWIALKSKPRKPRRSDAAKEHRASIDVEGRVSVLIEVLKDYPDDAFIEREYSSWDYDNFEYYVVWKAAETEEEYQKRLQAYLVRKEKYDAWYAENKELIEREIEWRAKDAEEKAAKKIAQEKARLEKELARLESKMEKAK